MHPKIHLFFITCHILIEKEFFIRLHEIQYPDTTFFSIQTHCLKVQLSNNYGLTN